MIEIFGTVAAGDDLQQRGHQFRRNGIEIAAGGKPVGVMRHQQQIGPFQPFGQLRPRDLSVMLAAEQRSGMIVVIHDQIVIPGIGIPFIREYGREFSRPVILFHLLPDQIPFAVVPEFRMADPAVIVVGQRGKSSPARSRIFRK